MHLERRKLLTGRMEIHACGMSHHTGRRVHAGGMLASWMRLKYPHILDGALAGSAPIWSYLGEHPVHAPTVHHLVAINRL